MVNGSISTCSDHTGGGAEGVHTHHQWLQAGCWARRQKRPILRGGMVLFVLPMSVTLLLQASNLPAKIKVKLSDVF